MFNPNKLKCAHLDLKATGAFETDLFKKTFKLWMDTWEKAYELYWSSSDIFSDQFTRQSSHLVIKHDHEIVGSVAYDKKNLNLISTRKDSYFRMWSDQSYNNLIQNSLDGHVLVCSWFTLNKNWRKSQKGLDAKKLLVATAIKEFERRDESVMCGTMVHTGNLHDVCYEHNATVIEKNTEEKGLPVDLMAWRREDIQNMRYPYYQDLLDSMFETDSTQTDMPTAA